MADAQQLLQNIKNQADCLSLSYLFARQETFYSLPMVSQALMCIEKSTRFLDWLMQRS